MRVVLLFCLIGLFGCATQFKTPSEAANSCNISEDKFTKTRLLSLNVYGGYLDPTSRFDKTLLYGVGGNDFVGFQIQAHSNSWVFFDRCFAENGESLNASRTDSKVVAGNHVVEQVIGVFKYDYFKSKALSGLEIKCIGTRGSLVIPFSAAEVSGFLQCIENFKK